MKKQGQVQANRLSELRYIVATSTSRQAAAALASRPGEETTRQADQQQNKRPAPEKKIKVSR